MFAGSHAWDWARHDMRRKLLLPPDSAPASFRWPVAGLELVVLDTGALDELLLNLSHELLLAGAVKVVVVPHVVPKTGSLAIFTQGVRRAAA